MTEAIAAFFAGVLFGIVIAVHALKLVFRATLYMWLDKKPRLRG